jgi:hypothetical protein
MLTDLARSPSATSLLAPVLALALGASCTSAQETKYGLASWPEAGRGNHRAVVRVAGKADAVWVHIPWRRRDRRPETKDVRVFDAATGKRLTNVVRVSATRADGDLVFQPATAPGDYEVYYLPYDPPGTGPFGDAGNYFPPEETADKAWVEKHELTPAGLARGKWRQLPQAQVVEIQARGEFHRMDPMEVLATEAEVGQLLAQHPDRQYLLFPEDRRRPIRMFEDLPYCWVERGPGDSFKGGAQPNEFYPFQLGVFAARRAVLDLRLRFTDLRAEDGVLIPAAALRCLNLSGTDWLGRPMRREFPVGKGKVRPLWIGVPIPRDAQGTYRGTVVVKPVGEAPTTVKLELTVKGPVLEDRGDSELWRYSRLRWLGSTLGLDDEVIPPFTPVQLRGDTARLLGREVRFADNGLPAGIRSGHDVLARPVDLVVESNSGPGRWAPSAGQVLKQAAGTVERESHSHGDGLTLTVHSKLEFDGCLTYRAALRATRALHLKDIRLEVPVRREVAKYMIGMGRRGGYRPAQWDWQWDVEQANNLVWLGDFDAGLQLKLCGPVDTWQMRDLRDTGVPQSWGNDGRGGCRITEEGGSVLICAYTGERRLEAGQELEFRFRFLITPFKPLDRDHWNWRYGDVSRDGNILHIHHGTPQNPSINYPFLAVDQLRETVRQVKSLRYKETDQGALTYPAAGNVNLNQGALHVWVRLNFDPLAGQPQQARYNQPLFGLDFPNEDQLGFYWNIDDRGMRTYVRKGAPTNNQYPVLFGTSSPDWRQGQQHWLTLSWGDQLAIFVDGKQVGAAPYKGTLTNSLAEAELQFQGGGFAIDALKITDVPFAEGAAVAPAVDDHTLLLDTFASWDGGERTRPEKIAAGGHGKTEGICASAAGQFGKEIVFSSRQVEVPPKGVNLYYTVRELSNHVAEMWALRSLGDEVFTTGGVDIHTDPEAADKPLKGYPWLREHLVTGYDAAWRTALGEGELDAAIGQQGLSRWHNYYVEGMRWLMQNTGLDGLYLDGIGYDREIMKRVAKVMCRADPNSRINFHSGDNWCPPWDNDRKLSAASNYMEHFPYLSNLWFGELFDYNASPDYWLVEISGIPFGLTGEMLNYQTGGNPYRGMIYGMTGRQHPSAPYMWQFWDEFGIQDAEMLGYWDPKCPVKTDHPRVLATVYRKPGKSLIALAHWSGERVRQKAVTRKATTPPTLDGRLAPNEWDGVAKLTNFTAHETDSLAQDQTEVFATHDAERLYLAFRCANPANRLKADAKERDGAVWEDDAVELFLQPDPQRPDCYQFVGNSAGVYYDGKGVNGGQWDGDWTYSASVGDGYWEGELSVLFSSLGMVSPAVQPGVEIGLNLCRDQQSPQQRLSCWSPVSGSFHNAEQFGRLTLSETQPPTRQGPDTLEASTKEIGVRLTLDWNALGLDPKKAKLTAPSLGFFQSRAEFSPNQEIPVEAGKGWLLVLGSD